MFLKSFFMKLAMTFIILWVILGWIYHVSFFNVVLVSVLLSMLGYLGDVFILPQLGITLTGFADFIITVAIVWMFAYFWIDDPMSILTCAFTSGLVIMTGEFYLHQFMETRIFSKQEAEPDERKGYYQRVDIQTEFAKEEEFPKQSSNQRNQK